VNPIYLSLDSAQYRTEQYNNRTEQTQHPPTEAGGLYF